jgi:hypothetical protein
MSDVIKLHKGTDMALSRPVDWLLAPGYLARGKINLLVGAEGIGKSLWTIRAIAAVTKGEAWGPFTMISEPADVVMIATEDGWEDTIRPRLEVAQADLSRVYVLCASDDGTGSPVSSDLHVLSESDLTPALVVVDSWVDTVPGGLSLKDAQKCRAALKPWKSYAADKNAAVLLVAHTNRSDSESSRDTYGLSGALRQVARSALYALEDADTSALLVGPEKSNLGVKSPAQRFQRTPAEWFPPTSDNDGTVAVLDYLGPDTLTINELVATTQRDKQDRPQRKTSEIDSWLAGILSYGRLRSTELERLAKDAGFSAEKLRRARERLDVKAVRDDGVWYSELNMARRQDGKMAEV